MMRKLRSEFLLRSRRHAPGAINQYLIKIERISDFLSRFGPNSLTYPLLYICSSNERYRVRWAVKHHREPESNRGSHNHVLLAAWYPSSFGSLHVSKIPIQEFDAVTT